MATASSNRNRIADRRDSTAVPPKRLKRDTFSSYDVNVSMDGCCDHNHTDLDETSPVVATAASFANGNTRSVGGRNVMEDSGPGCKGEAHCDDGNMRRKVNDLLHSFRKVLKELKEENEGKPIGYRKLDIHRDAATEIRRQGRCLNSAKRLGAVPGVEVGDEFESRAEMKIVGLHCQLQNGIDFMNDGSALATSIVESGRYKNSYMDENFLMYSGFGGNPFINKTGKLRDQKLEGGNLALKNSMSLKTPVRVISKEKSGRHQYFYKYRGLYMVEDLKQARSDDGKLIFKFLLRRIEGHPKVNWELHGHQVNWTLSFDEGALRATAGI